MTHEQNKCRCGRCVGIRLREAEARERILQQQNDAFDVMGADLSARIASLEAENAELKKVLKAQCVAAVNDRIQALEERLEQCEALHQASEIDAARAALEEK